MATDVGPAAAMQVGAMLFLDTGSGFSLEAAQAEIGRRVRSIPRLRQRLQKVPIGLGRPIWVDDGSFDITRHVSIDDGVGDRAALLALASDFVATRLPRERPLWAARLVPIGADSAALVMVFHHVVMDGIGGLAVLGGLVDGAPEASAAGFPQPAPTTGALARDACGERASNVIRLWRAPNQLRAALRELGASGRVRSSRLPLNRPTGTRRHLAVTRCDLATILKVARAHGGSVNDVVLAAVAGALGAVSESLGEPADRVVVSVPVTRRRDTTSTALGNQVGVVPMELPNLPDRRHRLRAVVEQGIRLRTTPRGASAQVLGPAFRALARLGCLGWLMNHQRLVNGFVTNLRGPEEELAFLTAPITDILPITGISGNVTVAFAVFSYAGALTITVVSDPEAISDPGQLLAALEVELGALTHLPPAGVEGSG
ncbi:MAG: wax ester/triacylglycerol synthase family O-acyltransferase [Microthrixaceae bacterium]